ncbi:MAG TPA: ABC transporter substrate-binding protein [Candidatus Pullichristensenella stercorigallinarum]|uniref:ABC transporter substrate-binding protein n=1 Tax=Candidatus Pullichristensenella stercorigallinarum TaxID=2840909 RepID=A0A9D0ZL79_9FIRM|nr:ABC transporter substrate-binding protein [Candidatus Pullichristensenella stercorigallinarum]
MSRMKSLAAMLLALAMLLGVAAVPALAEETRDDIVIALWSEPSTLCGGLAASTSVNMVSRQIFDTLIAKGDEAGTYEPCLATEWTWENDNTDLMFTLRDDVTFHNGEPMTTEDVAFSYNTIINAGYADTATSAMDSMEVVDDTHVVLHFDFEYGPALECVSSDYMVIFPQAAYEESADFGRNPIGTGAYQFVEWLTGDRIVLTANENYFQGEPSIHDVTFRILTDTSVATLALQNGEIDVHTMIPQADVPNVQADPNLQYDEVLGNSTTWIIFNFDGIFADENLRLAVAHAIDKEGVMIGAIEGNGEVAQAIYANFVPGYDFDYEGPAYDPELSRQLLAEAGYPDGLDLTVRACSNIQYSRPLEIVQAYLADVGINLSIELMESNAWFEDVFKGGDFDINLVTFSMGMADLEELYALYRGGQSQNYGHMDDPDVNAAYDANHTSIDEEVRLEAFRTVQHVMGDRALTVPLYTAMNGIGANANLRGIKADQMGIYRVADWSWAA